MNIRFKGHIFHNITPESDKGFLAVLLPAGTPFPVVFRKIANHQLAKM